MKILTGRDQFGNPEKWQEIIKEEYMQNKNDIDNYIRCVDQDTGKVGFYKKLMEGNNSGNS